ncbi:hypothetical protein HAX54_025900 [Datura stramonium]|uniref:Uncharacterized protein n=1 Tax=Datura stramonium TaxID=4076 RepID=A0ABS8V0D0_DATST|nr:hypothetical protein [Datura stramonium]
MVDMGLVGEEEGMGLHAFKEDVTKGENLFTYLKRRILLHQSLEKTIMGELGNGSYNFEERERVENQARELNFGKGDEKCRKWLVASLRQKKLHGSYQHDTNRIKDLYENHQRCQIAEVQTTNGSYES